MTGKCIIRQAPSVDGLAQFLSQEREIYVVYDRNVEALAIAIAAAVEIPGQAGNETRIRSLIGITATEELKTMSTAVGITEKLMEENASRNALVLAVGGGITTDIAGFAASIYKRGVRYANVPTTLLAQVDAAIGGKTAVNLNGYKNMLGAFHMPEFTFICPEVLKTLPPKEMKNGTAELLKTFLTGDADAYRQAQKGITPELILRAAQIKAGIVERDPQEHGERAVLNLGHTFGHAIERCSGGTIPHGEAVGMGIVMAARVSEGIGLARKGLAQQIEADFRQAGLETECPYATEELVPAMKKDKKDGKFVLLEAPGKPVITTLSQDDLYKYTK